MANQQSEQTIVELKEANKLAMNTRKHKFRAFMAGIGLVIGKLTGGLVGGSLGAVGGGVAGDKIARGLNRRLETQTNKHC